MKNSIGVALSISLLISLGADTVEAKKTASAKGLDYPRLISGANTPEGKMALEIAKASFKANTPRLCESGDEVRAKVKSVVLCQNGQGEEWHAGSSIETVADKDGFTFVYFQKNKFNGKRFIVSQYTHSWRGDMHALNVAPESLSNEDAMSVLRVGGAPEPADTKGVKVVFGESWTGPWLAEKNGITCGIDTGHPAEPLCNWNVFGISQDEPVATIAFHPQVKDTNSLIPKGPLKEIALLLDSIVGTPKEWQGTLNANGRIHADVRYLWMDLVYRPWSLGTAYNTRANIERNLIKWSKGSKVYKQQYDRLKVLYPQAELQLVQHYKTRFGWSDAKCKEAAKKWMDSIYRAHFVFPSDG